MLVRAGDVVPGTYAGAREMTTIGDAIGEVDHGTIEIISDRLEDEQEQQWIESVARSTGRPVTRLASSNVGAGVWSPPSGSTQRACRSAPGRSPPGLARILHQRSSRGGSRVRHDRRSRPRDAHDYMARIVPTILLHFLHPWRSDVGGRAMQEQLPRHTRQYVEHPDRANAGQGVTLGRRTTAWQGLFLQSFCISSIPGGQM